MPNSNSDPILKPTRFDPASLERSIIALPLLAAMEEELVIIDAVKKEFPDILKEFDSAVVYNPAYSESEVSQAYGSVQELARKVAKETSAAFYRRMKQLKDQGRNEEQLKPERDREAQFQQ